MEKSSRGSPSSGWRGGPRTADLLVWRRSDFGPGRARSPLSVLVRRNDGVGPAREERRTRTLNVAPWTRRRRAGHDQRGSLFRLAPSRVARDITSPRSRRARRGTTPSFFLQQVVCVDHSECSGSTAESSAGCSTQGRGVGLKRDLTLVPVSPKAYTISRAGLCPSTSCSMVSHCGLRHAHIRVQAQLCGVASFRGVPGKQNRNGGEPSSTPTLHLGG